MPTQQTQLPNIARNRGVATAGPWQTMLDPATAQLFSGWLAGSGAPYDPSPFADYDMPGYFQAMLAGQFAPWTGGHFPDVYKTPYHQSFSAESKYAVPSAPSWFDSLLKDRAGNIIFDDRLGM